MKLLFCLLWFTALIGPCFAQTATPFRVEDAIGMHEFTNRSPVALSPDGKWLAYSLISQGQREEVDPNYKVYNRHGVPATCLECVLWVTNIDSHQAQQVDPAARVTWGGVWSPDGRRLAYFSDRGGEAGLWVWERDSRQTHRISKAVIRPFFGFDTARWTPDGKSLVVKLLPEGTTFEQAAALLRSAQDPNSSRSPGSSARAFTTPDLAPNPTTGPGQDRWIRDTYMADIAVIDVASGAVRRIVRNCATLALILSPDGSNVLFGDLLGHEAQQSQQLLFDITVVPLAGGGPRILVPKARMIYGYSVSWSPDSKSIAYTTQGRFDTARSKVGDCFLITLADGAIRNLTEGTPTNFGIRSHYRPPAWDADGKNLFLAAEGDGWLIPVSGGPVRRVIHEAGWTVLEIASPVGGGRVWSPDGHSVYAYAQNSATKRVAFLKADLSSATQTPVIEEEKYYGGGSPLTFAMDTSADRQRFVYIAEGTGSPPDAYMVDPSFREPHRVTNINPSLGSYRWGSGKVIEWTTDNGDHLKGALLLPVDYQEGRRYPLVVIVYGGEVGSRRVFWFEMGDLGSHAQLLATRGYAVLIPDIPMGTTTPMRDIATAVLPALNRVIELGIADPDRMGVTGQSYGGYSTLALIVQTARFKAAISRSGIGNLISSYGTLNVDDGSSFGVAWSEEGQGAMRATPWASRAKYIENSPVSYLDRVSTPVMLTAGSHDPVCPPFLSEEVFVGLRRLGKTATYVLYEGGSHTEESSSRADAIDYYNRAIAWFDRWLKTPGPTGSAQP